MSKTCRILLLLLLTAVVNGQAENLHTQLKDSAAIHFHQSKWNLDLSLGENASILDSIHKKLTVIQDDSIYRMRHVSVIGGASPEGSVEFNKFLSEKRAETLFDRFRQYSKLDDADMTFTYLGRDWEGVLSLALLDPDLPYRYETIALLEKTAAEKRKTGKDPANSLGALKRLRGGVPYNYLYKNIFPKVRASKIIIDYSRILSPAIAIPELEQVILCNIDSVENADTIVRQDTIIHETVRRKPFFMDLRTNLLYDAVALPNVGVEFHMGGHYSLGMNWMYGWWSKNISHVYWRAYGGEVFSRYWFGKMARRKPLTGFHAGIYAQYYMYDFELGGKGEMAGNPEENLWEKGMYGGGLEFGFSIPFKKRLNVDISIGVGYSGGTYHKYIPIDTHYVWQGTYRRNYVGPTKAEVALVWLIGPGNVNRTDVPSARSKSQIKKGGIQ